MATTFTAFRLHHLECILCEIFHFLAHITKERRMVMGGKVLSCGIQYFMPWPQWHRLYDIHICPCACYTGCGVYNKVSPLIRWHCHWATWFVRDLFSCCLCYLVRWASKLALIHLHSNFLYTFYYITISGCNRHKSVDMYSAVPYRRLLSTGLG